MTPTPEDTAFVAIQFWCDDPEGTDDDLRAILNKLARDAEDAAYERGRADYIEGVRNCVLIDKKRYAKLRGRRITGADENAPFPAGPEPEPFILKSPKEV